MNKKSSLINTKVEGKELNKFLNKTTKELKKITLETVNLYNRQCQVLKKQIKALIKLEPNRNFDNAHMKWEKELGVLEDNYNLIFDKSLKEKKELDKVTRLNLY